MSGRFRFELELNTSDSKYALFVNKLINIETKRCAVYDNK